MAKWLALLLHIQEVSGSNFGPETTCPDGLLVVFHWPSKQYQDSTLSHNCFPLFHFHFIIRYSLCCSISKEHLVDLSMFVCLSVCLSVCHIYCNKIPLLKLNVVQKWDLRPQ
jgi:hypothetical protein